MVGYTLNGNDRYNTILNKILPYDVIQKHCVIFNNCVSELQYHRPLSPALSIKSLSGYCLFTPVQVPQ